MGVLILSGSWKSLMAIQLWITFAICILIVIIAISYNQTIHAYPKGGGSYIVASDNLGETPGLIAGASIMIDYILTVAVSISAGVAALVSAFPGLHAYLQALSLFFVAAVAWANLRGVRESGRVFAIPTYAFITGVLVTILFGLYRTLTTHIVVGDPLTDLGIRGSEGNVLLLYVILRAFSAGCTALTGIEAVSDGVQAFKPPESKNASTTLRWMAILLLLMFLGIGYLAEHLPHVALYGNANPNYRTVVSQVAEFAFGENSFGFYFIQFATAAILILAANTAFADFPRLCSFIARDGYLPRPLARQGDRLVFHNGIVLLSIAAGTLIWYFHGELQNLLPLYAIGVFSAFTLSQSGMVARWYRGRADDKNWRTKAIINAIGATLSGIVLLVILATKFVEGAWIVALLIPMIYAGFKMIHSRYNSISRQLAFDAARPAASISSHLTLLMVPRVHRGIIDALQYTKARDANVIGVHVTINDKTLPEVQRLWSEHAGDTPLLVLRSPYRSLLEPILTYVDTLRNEDPGRVVTVVVPEAVSTRWWHKLLQENVGIQLKAALGSRRGVVVSNVRYFLD